MPFEDVRKALDAKSKLLKFNCLDSELQVVHDSVGDYIVGSDNEALVEIHRSEYLQMLAAAVVSLPRS